MIKLKNVSKKYGDTLALDDISLEIHDKEFLVVLGPSGCGKTTLLRIIAGLDQPTSGKVFLNDNDLALQNFKERNNSMVFQDFALFPNMNVYENIAFGLKTRKFKRNEIRERVEKACENLKISDLLKRKPNQLSGGQQQRVALARAIVKEPNNFLFDEPLSSLDTNLKDEFIDIFKEMHSNYESSFVYVTHAQNEALQLADRIVVLSKGKILQDGSVDEIFNRPNCLAVAKFLGEPKINVIDDKDSNVHIAIRPEKISIDTSKNEKSICIKANIYESYFASNGYILKAKTDDMNLTIFSVTKHENGDCNLYINPEDFLVFYNDEKLDLSLSKNVYYDGKKLKLR